MINPYYIYILTFSAALIVYQFGWSTLFPILKPSLLVFLIGSMIVAAVFGLIFQAKRYVSYRTIEPSTRIRSTVNFIIILWVIEFIYNGGVPLFMIIGGADYNYITFGVPTLHVFVVTFTSFFCTYLFHVYISTKDRKILLYYFICMSFAVLLFNRGMLMINVISSGIVYLQSIRRISLPKTFGIAVVMVMVLYLFGVLGHLRTSHGRHAEYSGRYIMDIVSANYSFEHGPVPSEFIWTYAYLSSPIGNLQYNIDREYRVEANMRNAVLFVNNEFLPDFISKRIDAVLDAKRVACIRFIDSLTVASVYTNSYIYAGWFGMTLMSFFILATPIVYLGLVRKQNPFYVTATSILGSLYLFLVFDNMFTFSGLSFQLIFPLLLGRLFRSKEKRDVWVDGNLEKNVEPQS